MAGVLEQKRKLPSGKPLKNSCGAHGGVTKGNTWCRNKGGRCGLHPYTEKSTAASSAEKSSATVNTCGRVHSSTDYCPTIDEMPSLDPVEIPMDSYPMARAEFQEPMPSFNPLPTEIKRGLIDGVSNVSGSTSSLSAAKVDEKSVTDRVDSVVDPVTVQICIVSECRARACTESGVKLCADHHRELVPNPQLAKASMFGE